MIDMKHLLDMVATDAVMPEDETGKPIIPERHSSHQNLPPIRYNLELIKGPDGRLYWRE